MSFPVHSTHIPHVFKHIFCVPFQHCSSSLLYFCQCLFAFLTEADYVGLNSSYSSHCLRPRSIMSFSLRAASRWWGAPGRGNRVRRKWTVLMPRKWFDFPPLWKCVWRLRPFSFLSLLFKKMICWDFANVKVIFAERIYRQCLYVVLEWI